MKTKRRYPRDPEGEALDALFDEQEADVEILVANISTFDEDDDTYFFIEGVQARIEDAEPLSETAHKKVKRLIAQNGLRNS